MSMGAYDSYYDADPYGRELPPLPGRGRWNTLDGRRLKIRDMNTSHLINSMAMLWRLGMRVERGLISSYHKPSTAWIRAKIAEMKRELETRP